MSGVCYKYHDKKKRMRLSEEEKFFSMQKSHLDPDNMSPLLIIQDDELKIVGELGSGAFGQVFQGIWKAKIPNSTSNEEIKCRTQYSITNFNINKLNPFINSK